MRESQEIYDSIELMQMDNCYELYVWLSDKVLGYHAIEVSVDDYAFTHIDLGDFIRFVGDEKVDQICEDNASEGESHRLARFRQLHRQYKQRIQANTDRLLAEIQSDTPGEVTRLSC